MVSPLQQDLQRCCKGPALLKMTKFGDTPWASHGLWSRVHDEIWASLITFLAQAFVCVFLCKQMGTVWISTAPHHSSSQMSAKPRKHMLVSPPKFHQKIPKKLHRFIETLPAIIGIIPLSTHRKLHPAIIQPSFSHPARATNCHCSDPSSPRCARWHRPGPGLWCRWASCPSLHQGSTCHQAGLLAT